MRRLSILEVPASRQARRSCGDDASGVGSGCSGWKFISRMIRVLSLIEHFQESSIISMCRFASPNAKHKHKHK